MADRPYTDADRDWLASELPELASPGGGLSFDRRDVAALALDALAAAGWVPPREVKRLRVLERMAAKHASERDRDIAAAEAKLLTLRAEIERRRQREAQHHADRAAEDLAELSATPPEGGDRG